MASHSFAASARRAVASLLLLGLIAGGAFALMAWKHRSIEAAAAAAAQQPEPSEAVEGAIARTRSYARSTTAIGTVRALQSITARNELSGTVRKVGFQAGQIVDRDAVLVELDVAVEQAERAALQAESRLAESMLKRIQEAQQQQGASAADVDRAEAERDKAVANVARTSALIDRKRVKAPFRARAGMVDLHVGQYLEPGTEITTLQGVDDAVHIDFTVTQEAAMLLAVGGSVAVMANGHDTAAQIVAIDSRVEAATRNTWIRALLTGVTPLPQPGASVRVRAGVEAAHEVVVVPVTALRRGPSGDHVFLLVLAPDGKLRATMRRVTAGASLGDEVIIKTGVAVGERVAAAGSFKLREGVLVHDQAATPQAK